MFRSVMILASALALMACDGPTKPKALWYEGQWIAQGLPVRADNSVDALQLDTLEVYFGKAFNSQNYRYTVYWRGAPSSQGNCPGFTGVYARGDTVTTANDFNKNVLGLCLSRYYEHTFVRSGNDLTYKWGTRTVRLVREVR